MTDRVQQMLDVVRNDFEVAIKKPRGRRAKAILRAKVRSDMSADAREGILKSPIRNETDGANVSAQSGFDTSYSGPSNPDTWRKSSIPGESVLSKTRGGPKIDPADAALAAFQSAKLGTQSIGLDGKSRKKGKLGSRFSTPYSGRHDPVSKDRFGRKSKSKKHDNLLEKKENSVRYRDIASPKKRGSWLALLRRS
jgi:hypothetical protein